MIDVKAAAAQAEAETTAAIFWLKARAGWKETSVHALSGMDGSARPILIISIDRSDAEL